jgi:tetratricopeptide (TPR) repeat protein
MHRFNGLRPLLAGLLVAGLLGLPIAPVSAEVSEAKPPSVISPAFAAVQKKRLDTLFDRLQAATSEVQGHVIVAEIWQVWTQSGNPNVDVLMRRAQVAVQGGDMAAAITLLDQVVAMAPDYAEGWNRRATFHYMAGRQADSIADIVRTLELEPRHFGALAGLGMIYAQRENWTAALKAFEKAAEVNPWLAERDRLLPELRKKAQGQAL